MAANKDVYGGEDFYITMEIPTSGTAVNYSDEVKMMSVDRDVRTASKLGFGEKDEAVSTGARTTAGRLDVIDTGTLWEELEDAFDDETEFATVWSRKRENGKRYYTASRTLVTSAPFQGAAGAPENTVSVSVIFQGGRTKANWTGL